MFFSAARYAAASPWGSNLGLGARVQVEWRGLCRILWRQLCRATTFCQFLPYVLVIHLGGNDLAWYHEKGLILGVLHDLSWLKAMYLAMKIVWSLVVIRLAWRDARIFFSRPLLTGELFSRSAEWSASSLESVIGHQRICMDRSELFWNDGVHLSDLGLDVFLEDIGGGCLLSLIGSMVGMGLSRASPYAVAGSVNITGFLVSPIANSGKLSPI